MVIPSNMKLARACVMFDHPLSPPSVSSGRGIFALKVRLPLMLLLLPLLPLSLLLLLILLLQA